MPRLLWPAPSWRCEYLAKAMQPPGRVWASEPRACQALALSPHFLFPQNSSLLAAFPPPSPLPLQESPRWREGREGEPRVLWAHTQTRLQTLALSTPVGGAGTKHVVVGILGAAGAPAMSTSGAEARQ